VIVGVITNNSVETTVRMAGNLGTDWNGTFRSAEDVHAMSLANLEGEYCNVVTTASLLPSGL
jgi:hypothetical protein